MRRRKGEPVGTGVGCFIVPRDELLSPWLMVMSKAVNKDFFRLEKIFSRREILYVDDEYRNNHTRNDRYLPKTGSRAFNTFWIICNKYSIRMK